MRHPWIASALFVTVLSGCGHGSAPAAASAAGIEPLSARYSCDTPEVGDYNLVSGTVSGMVIPAHYKLIRKESPSDHPAYDILVDFEFSDSGNPNSRSARALRERTRQCLAAAEPYLKSPDGTEFTIRLAEPGDPAPLPQKQIIEVTQTAGRDDMYAWNADLGCEGILHETLHHLGLVDEYKETGEGLQFVNGAFRPMEPGQSPAWGSPTAETASATPFDCRALGPTDSMMNDPYLALDSHFVLYQEVYCTCGTDDSRYCQDALDAMTGKEHVCPPSATWQFPRDSLQFSTLDLHVDEGEAGSAERLRRTIRALRLGPDDRDGVRILASSPLPSSAPLLMPAEARAILYPGCARKNQIYYRCARNAYRTSDREGCLTGLPRECQEGRTRWITQ